MCARAQAVNHSSARTVPCIHLYVCRDPRAIFAGVALLILKELSVDKLMGSEEPARATILLFFFHGTAAAGFTYCMTVSV